MSKLIDQNGYLLPYERKRVIEKKKLEYKLKGIDSCLNCFFGELFKNYLINCTLECRALEMPMQCAHWVRR